MASSTATARTPNATPSRETMACTLSTAPRIDTDMSAPVCRVVFCTPEARPAWSADTLATSSEPTHRPTSTSSGADSGGNSKRTDRNGDDRGGDGRARTEPAAYARPCGAPGEPRDPQAQGARGHAHVTAAPLHFRGERLMLDPMGGLFWPEQRLLAVSDLHLEKGSSFARRGMLTEAPGEFSDVVELARSFLQPVARAIAEQQTFRGQWNAGGPWPRPDHGFMGLPAQIVDNAT